MQYVVHLQKLPRETILCVDDCQTVMVPEQGYWGITFDYHSIGTSDYEWTFMPIYGFVLLCAMDDVYRLKASLPCV